MDFQKLRKTELHCHLDGSLAIDMLKRHLNREITPQMLSVNDDCGSLAEYLQKFELPLECLQDAQGLTEGAYTFIRDVTADGVDYIEVRFAPMLSAHDGFSCGNVIEAVLDGLKKGEERWGVRSRIIVCAMRHHPEEMNLKMLQSAREYLGNGVCALDLAGDEAAFPTRNFVKLFREAKRLEMPFTIHSGETGSLENVRLALELGAGRIGHGIALGKDKEMMREYARRGIGVEMCPTSNLQTKAVTDWKEYPLKEFVDAGIKVSVNTDNRTVSDTTMTKELERVYQLYGEDEQLIHRVLRNAQETAFEHLI